MKRQICMLFSLLLVIVGFTSTANAEMVTLYASQDAWVDSANPSSTPSDSPFLSIYSSSNSQRWSYFQFDLSSIPDTAVISKAQFSLYGSASWSTASDWTVPYNRYPHFYHVSDDTWIDSTLTWDNKGGYDSLLGVSYPGSAFTWSNAYFTNGGTDNWDEGVDLNDDLLSIVGLIGDTMGYSASYSAYSEGAGGTTNGPQLYLEYTYEDPGLDPGATVPEPSTLLLLGIGFLGLIGYGRKKIG